MQAYPLNWPTGWPRTKFPKRARFGKISIGKATREILHELKLMGVPDWNVIISTNLKLRKYDGLPLSNQRQPDDQGVAVHFRLKDKPQCIPCDRWARIEHNMHAIALTIGALRGLDRWGAKEMVEAAFTGFKALPGGEVQVQEKEWHEVLGCTPDSTLETAERHYKGLAKIFHPDKEGGFNEKMAELNKAMETARICAR